MTQLHDLPLAGCHPDPLMGYLKALGVLRLVSEQADPTARGCWQGEAFHLWTALTEEGLIRFFTGQYRPTPIVAPWNGGSGFWEDRKAAGQALSAIESSSNPRLAEYRQVIGEARGLLDRLGIKAKPEKEEQKPELLAAARSWLPDSAVRWLDAAYVLGEDKPKYPPLLGIGGCDGNLDFTSNFMQNILSLIPTEEAPPGESANRARKVGGRMGRSSVQAEEVRGRLELALFQRGSAPLVTAAIGQFHPGGVGGPNGLQGFEAGSLTNPWDFVLMIEGALFFAGSVTWRLGGTAFGQASSPFAVRVSSAGWGTLAEPPGLSSRAEVWLPLWRQFASTQELTQLFSEGRAVVGRGQARSGVDFARAVASLGVDRGIEAFTRYGFLARSGKAYLAAPLGRMTVRAQPAVDLIQEIDPWLNTFRRLAEDKEAPAACRRALRGIEDAIFAYCLRGGRRGLQDVLAALGRGEQTLAASPKLHDRARPLQGLTPRWLQECDDGSPEFRLAAALASIGEPGVGPLRTNLEPVEARGSRWQWAEDNPSVVWGGGDLVRNLAAVLERRLLESGRQNLDHPGIRGRLAARLEDVREFLRGQVDDSRLADLLWALGAMDWQAYAPAGSESEPRRAASREVPRAYALFKLLFLPHPVRLRGLAEPIKVRVEPAVISRLRAGDLDQAVAIAVRRLRASGLTVLAGERGGGRTLDFLVSETEKKRLLATLLFPLEQPEILAGLVLQAPRVTA